MRAVLEQPDTFSWDEIVISGQVIQSAAYIKPVNVDRLGLDETWKLKHSSCRAYSRYGWWVSLLLLERAWVDIFCFFFVVDLRMILHLYFWHSLLVYGLSNLTFGYIWATATTCRTFSISTSGIFRIFIYWSNIRVVYDLSPVVAVWLIKKVVTMGPDFCYSCIFMFLLMPR